MVLIKRAGVIRLFHLGVIIRLFADRLKHVIRLDRSLHVRVVALAGTLLTLLTHSAEYKAGKVGFRRATIGRVKVGVHAEQNK